MAVNYLIGTVVTLAVLVAYAVHADRRLFGNRKARRDLLRSVPRWSDAKPGELGALEGVVEAVHETMVTPIAGARAVWHRLRGYEMDDGAIGRDLVDLLTENDFVVRGAEGSVLVAGRSVPRWRHAGILSWAEEDEDAVVTDVSDTGTVVEASDVLKAFAAAKGVESLGAGDWVQRPCAFREVYVPVGAPMLVVARKPAPPVAPETPSPPTSAPPAAEMPELLATSSQIVLEVAPHRKRTLAIKIGLFAVVFGTITWLLATTVAQMLLGH